MKVKDLISRLQTMDPEALVLEECKGELRELTESDVRFDLNTNSPTTYWLADGGETDQSVVILGAWS